MHVHICQVSLEDNRCIATACVTAENVEIRMVVRFSCPSDIPNVELLQQARYEILRYLDIL
jgi:hypothetical protein